MDRVTKYIDASANSWRKGGPLPLPWGLLLLLVFTGNALVATIAWISVRLATQYFLAPGGGGPPIVLQPCHRTQ
jgi:hypothetical protein